MSDTALKGTRPQWSALDRTVILLLVPVFVLGTPGFGPETRQFSSDAIATVLALVLLAPAMAALALSWKQPALAAKIGVIGGLLLIAVAVVDLLGLIVGPPPTGMILVDVMMLLVAAAVAWRCWRLVRG